MPLTRGLPGLLANTLVASPAWSPSARARLLGLLGTTLEGPARVVGWIRFLGSPADLTLGRGCYVNAGLTVGAGAEVVVGSWSHIGPGVSLLPTSHEVGASDQRAGRTSSKPITIGAGSWLGAGVTVLGGVDVAPGTVVGAHALVAASTEPDCLYAGVPARLVRRLDTSDAPAGPGGPRGDTRAAG